MADFAKLFQHPKVGQVLVTCGYDSANYEDAALAGNGGGV